MPQAIIHGRNYGTGRRKCAVARVFLKAGEGKVVINGRTPEDYFPRETLRMIMNQPFDLLEKNGAYDIEVNVHGGGIAGQAEAVRHGISRALLSVSADNRTPLKRAGYLTRDSRKVERKKPGQPGARKRFQYSKR
ncbi:MAG: ribosomal protein S9p [Myxococcaceae bacterium]|nr:ribosomal protein S9p [Myxococcaceae bacterium]